MAHWNTIKVQDDLKKLPGVTAVINRGCGGDCDSDNLEISVAGTREHLYVCAFTTDGRDNSKDDPSNDHFPMVEVCDGTDSRGGLQCDSEELGVVYVKVRKYFLGKGFEVVAHLKDYF